jgi:hypothetical protein
MKPPERSDRETVYCEVEKLIPVEAWESTTAIMRVQRPNVYQFGTGTLVRVADESFLVTAAHVVEQAMKHENSLCITGAKNRFVGLRGDWISSSSGERKASEDQHDVGIVRLHAQTCDELNGARFLRFDDVSLSEDLATGVFCIFGFPAIWAGQSTDDDTVTNLKRLQYTSYAFDGDTRSLLGYEPQIHLLLSADLAESKDLHGGDVAYSDRKGNSARFPGDLGGISGCAVWKMGDLKVPLAEWGKQRPKLVAVQTGVYHGPRAIKATRWAFVVALMRQALPSLRPALEMWRGG